MRLYETLRRTRRQVAVRLSVLSQERDKITVLEEELQSKCIDIGDDFKQKTGVELNRGMFVFTDKYGHAVTDSNYRHKLSNPYTAEQIKQCCEYARSKPKDSLDTSSSKLIYAKIDVKTTQEKLKKLKGNSEPEHKNFTGEIAAIIGLVGVIFIIMIGWLLVYLAAVGAFGTLPQLIAEWLAPIIEFNQGPYLEPLVLFAVTVIIEIGGIVAIVKLLRYSSKATKEYKSKCQEHESNSDGLERRLQLQLNEMEELQKQISESEKVIEKISWGISHASQYEAKFDAEIENTERKIYPIQVTCNKIYEALQREYSSILDERDWKYLDLIIFYYETGRAFTRQEALQQVDREMQTNRIVNSIKSAASYIGNTIRMGTYIISSQIEGLSRQLSNISLDIKELNVNVKSLNSSLEVATGNQEKQIQALQQQNRELQSLVSAANLSNALQEKANTTSERLMVDVNYIRNYTL